MAHKDKIIDRIVSVINAIDPDSEVYLYGSRARGDSSRRSDWDLLILLNMNKVSFAYETKIMDDFYDIELDTGEVISPLIYSKRDWINKHSITPLFENIEKEGVQIK
jgi:predicted nucleotidyltransferase